MIIHKLNLEVNQIMGSQNSNEEYLQVSTSLTYLLLVYEKQQQPFDVSTTPV